MDELKQEGKRCKIVKSSLLKRVDWKGGKVKFKGKSHIKQKDYGAFVINGMHPLTNRYVKQVKAELRAGYRAKKRSIRQKVKKEINSEIQNYEKRK